MPNFDIIVQKTAYFILHYTTLWLLLAFLFAAGAARYLAYILDQHNNRMREAKLARRTALFNVTLAAVLWLLSNILG